MRTESGFVINQWQETNLTVTGAAAQMIPASASTAITVLAHDGLYATVTATAHGLFDGESAAVTGASDANWNGYFVMKVIDANTLFYTMLGVPATTTLGTAAVSTFKVAQAIVISDAGNSQNVGIGPSSAANLYPVTTGAFYTIPAIPNTDGRQNKIDLAQCYTLAVSGSQTLRIMWILLLATGFFFCESVVAQPSGVQQLKAGSGVTLTPAGGVGVVTISASGGGGGATNGIQQLNGTGTNTTLNGLIVSGPTTNLPVTLGNAGVFTNVPAGTNGNFVISDSSKLGGTKFVADVNLTPAFIGSSITALNGSQVTSGTVPAAALTSIVATNIQGIVGGVSTNRSADYSTNRVYVNMTNVAANINVMQTTNLNNATNANELLWLIQGDGVHSISINLLPASETVSMLNGLTNGFVPPTGVVTALAFHHFANSTITNTLVGFASTNAPAGGGGGSGTVTSVTADGTFATGTITTSGSFTPVSNPTFGGVNITALNASQLTSGTVADARLSTNVPLLNASAQTWNQTGTNSFGSILATNLATIATNNTPPTAGFLGEVVSNYVAAASAVSLTASATVNVASISLTAGHWSVSANENVISSAATAAGVACGISATSATLSLDGSECYDGSLGTILSGTNNITVPPKPIFLSTTTTINLVSKQGTISAGSLTAFGSITARRSD